jgi:hypothetical protein
MQSVLGDVPNVRHCYAGSLLDSEWVTGWLKLYYRAFADRACMETSLKKVGRWIRRQYRAQVAEVVGLRLAARGVPKVNRSHEVCLA